MNRNGAIGRFAVFSAQALTLCVLLQLSACGGGGSTIAVAPPPPGCTQHCIIEPFKTTSNFALLETQQPYPVEYSTGAGADWNVLSWGQQSGVTWNSFTITNPSSTQQVYASSTLATADDPMSVSFERDPTSGAWTSTTLDQTATTFCGSIPQEFDFFLQPNDPMFVPTNPSGIGYPTGSMPTLDKVTGLHFQGTVTLVAASQSTSSFECPVNQSSVIPSLILSSRSGQTIFYQLGIAVECYPGTDPVEGCIHGGVGEYFCIGSDPYCISDPITSFGHAFLNPGDSIAMDGINIAPRLRALIRGGSPDGKMDTNPADWKLTDMYFGQNAWGRANLETQWTGEFLVQLTY